MKASEFIYMVRMVLKENHEESDIENSHIVWLADKARAELIQSLINNNSLTPQLIDLFSDELCLSVTPFKTYEFSTEKLLRSTIKVPDCFRDFIRVYPIDKFSSNEFSFVPFRSFSYAGNYSIANRNTVYVTIAPDNYIYVKSKSNAVNLLNKVIISTIFFNTEEVSSSGCCASCSSTDLEDANLAIPQQFTNTILATVLQKIVPNYQFVEDSAVNKHNDHLMTDAKDTNE